MIWGGSVWRNLWLGVGQAEHPLACLTLALGNVLILVDESSLVRRMQGGCQFRYSAGCVYSALRQSVAVVIFLPRMRFRPRQERRRESPQQRRSTL